MLTPLFDIASVQVHWLYWAYRLEFLGENVFLQLWVMFRIHLWASSSRDVFVGRRTDVLRRQHVHPLQNHERVRG